MAKRIIVLDKVRNAPGIAYRFALWAAIPATRQSFYADATATSAWTGASAAEITAIQQGAVVERVETNQWPAGTPIATIQADLLLRWNVFQAECNVNLYDRYGSYNDSVTGWTAGGVA